MEYRKVSDIVELEQNPRTISKKDFKRLKTSIENNPDYFEARPLILSDRTGELVVIAGNQRLKVAKHLKHDQVPTYLLKDLTKERENEIIIRDNISNGEWDFDILANEWDLDALKFYGLELPNIKPTEELSGLEYESIYYEPDEVPNLELKDCIDLKKYNDKIKALDEYELSKEQKELLKIFAYRFIKIDFEQVANYYFFNASEPEQKAIERLRLVLTDNGVNGFIEDDLIKLLSFTDENYQ